MLVADRALRAENPQGAAGELARALSVDRNDRAFNISATALTQARRDVEQALSVTLDYFTTRAEQQRALEILKFKLDILWAMNDAMALGYASQR